MKFDPRTEAEIENTPDFLGAVKNHLLADGIVSALHKAFPDREFTKKYSVVKTSPEILIYVDHTESDEIFYTILGFFLATKIFLATIIKED